MRTKPTLDILLSLTQHRIAFAAGKTQQDDPSRRSGHC
jgi:hypothetical protein